MPLIGPVVGVGILDDCSDLDASPWLFAFAGAFLQTAGLVTSLVGLATDTEPRSAGEGDVHLTVGPGSAPVVRLF